MSLAMARGTPGALVLCIFLFGCSARSSTSVPDSDLLIVLPGAASHGGVSYDSGNAKPLTVYDADAILESGRCPAVSSAAPVVRTRLPVAHGHRSWVPLFIYGTTPAF